MTQFYAQPYDLSATGFSFESYEEFSVRSRQIRNAYGDVVEEHEIQFLDGEAIDCELAKVVGLHQGNIKRFVDITTLWSDDDKLRFIIAVGECGYAFDFESDDPNEIDVDIYHLTSMRQLAEEFVDQGNLGDIPEALLKYFDYDAFARDLSVDYSEITVAGNLAYIGALDPFKRGSLAISFCKSLQRIYKP